MGAHTGTPALAVLEQETCYAFKPALQNDSLFQKMERREERRERRQEGEEGGLCSWTFIIITFVIVKKKTLKYTSICKWIDELWYPCQEILLRKKKE